MKLCWLLIGVALPLCVCCVIDFFVIGVWVLFGFDCLVYNTACLHVCLGCCLWYLVWRLDFY